MKNYNNILIIEAYTDSNIGSAALVENSLNLLKSKYPEANYKVMAHYPQAFRDLYSVDSVEDFFKYPLGKSRISQYVWLTKTLFFMSLSLILPGKLRKAVFGKRLQDFYWADLIVSVGAERINDKYIKMVVFALYTYAIIKKMKKTLVIFPTTFGPFLHNWTKWLTKKVIKNIDIIYTRDQASYDTCSSMLNEKSKAKLINTTDVAIFQDWKKTNIDAAQGQPVVGISVMEWTYKANSHETPYSNFEAYKNEMVQLVDKIIAKYNVHVVLYPTNYPTHGAPFDDVIVCKDIYDSITNKTSASYVEELLTPFEFKSRLSASEVNITTRMHACILSTGAYVPTVSVNYLFKLKEYMNGLGLSDYTIDIEDFEHKATLELFDNIWNDRENCRLGLESTMTKKKKQLDDVLNQINDIH